MVGTARERCLKLSWPAAGPHLVNGLEYVRVDRREDGILLGELRVKIQGILLVFLQYIGLCQVHSAKKLKKRYLTSRPRYCTTWIFLSYVFSPAVDNFILSIHTLFEPNNLLTDQLNLQVLITLFAICSSVVDSNSLNFDPDPGLCYPFWKNVL